MKKSDDVYRRQIVGACAKIEGFVSGLSKDAFLSSEVVQSAAIMQLAVISRYDSDSEACRTGKTIEANINRSPNRNE